MNRLNICILLFATLAFTAKSQATLSIKTNGGTILTYSLDGLQKLSFRDGKLNVYQNNIGHGSFFLRDIKQLNFKQISAKTQNLFVTSNPEFSFYPNPTSDELVIRWKNDLLGEVQIQLLNLQGEVVLNQKKDIDSNVIDIKLQLKNLSSGIYICRLSNQQSFISQKIIINK